MFFSGKSEVECLVPVQPIATMVDDSEFDVRRAVLSRFLWCVFGLLLFGLAASARADGLVEIVPSTNFVDLSDAGLPIAANRKNLVIEVPSGPQGAPTPLQLTSAGPGAEYTWTVFSIRNAGTTERKLVLLVEEQRFSGSGLWKLKPFGEKPFGLEMSAGQETLEREPVQGGDAATFSIAPGMTISFAIEGKSRITTAQLYSQEAFATREASLAFVRGAAIAVAGLLTFLMVAMFGIRKHPAFLAGGFFAFTAAGFMAMESGYLGNLMVRLAQQGVALDTVRSIAESGLLLGLATVLFAFFGLWRRELGYKLLGFAVILFAVVTLVYALFAPITATVVARWGFALLAVLAFITGYALRNAASGVVRNGMVLWALLLIWVFYCAVVAIDEKPALWHHVALLLYLAMILAVMAVTLVRFAFAQGYLAQPLLKDASRRSLALAGAQHHLWDWQPAAQALHIGPELPRDLGYDVHTWAANPAVSFLGVLHPDDEPAYAQLLSLRGIKPHTFYELELRLRSASGEDRWYSLRVKALPGGHGRIERCIGTLTDITRNKVTEDRLISDAVRDPVTSLPSRAIFQDRLAREIAKPLGLPVSVIFVGLQRFKTLNDGLGHDLGDQLLLVAGQRIKDCLVGDESVARLSGSQFVVMFIETIDGRGLDELVKQIQNAIAAPITLGNHEVIMTAAIGVSLPSSEGFTDDELLDQASSALASAQKQGQGTVVYFESTMSDERAARLSLEADLRRAMARGEIDIVYQPIFVLQTRELAGFEALARWRHPEQGEVPPAKFLSMAEQAGLMRELTTIVLSEVTRQMGIWQRTLIRSRPIFAAVNLPADELNDLGFVERLRGLMSREGVRPNALKIEITESMAIRHPDRAQQLIQRLQTIGVGVACDDFGTGFSSLASLRDLPFDTLKVDRSFLHEDGLEGRGGIILDTVVQLAHSLGMLVVGEGIESDVQFQRLVDLGCDLGQGHFLSEPLAARDAQELLVVLPRVEPVDEQVRRWPVPGSAPMAPRRVHVEERPELDEADSHYRADDPQSAGPEELPSIYAVAMGMVPTPKKVARPQRVKPKAKRKKVAKVKKRRKK